LDVGFFGPMKSAWRKQLKAYADQDPTAKLLVKTEFPRMLKELIASLSPEKHLPTAFEKCGLFPINRNKVLERIPSTMGSVAIARHLDTQLLRRLEVRRFGEGKKKPRGKKVPAGQSYSRVEEGSSEEDNDLDDLDSNSELEEEEAGPSKQHNKEQDKNVEEDSSEEEDNEELPDLNKEQDKNVEEDSSEEEDNEELPDLNLDRPTRKPGSYVVALYEGEWFVAEVVEDQSNVPNSYTRLSYMLIKGKNSFSWGPKKDIVVTLDEDIILEDVELEPVNSRGHFGLKKKDMQKIISWMVVVYFPLYWYWYIFQGRGGRPALHTEGCSWGFPCRPGVYCGGGDNRKALGGGGGSLGCCVKSYRPHPYLRPKTSSSCNTCT
jgi:hypothetical protein